MANGLRNNWRGSRRFLNTLPIMGLLLMGSFMPQAQGADSTPVFLPNSIKPVEEAPPGGAINPHRPFISRHSLRSAESDAQMEFEISLKMRNFSELQERIGSGELISPAEMAARYDPTASDYQAVTDWMTSQGFKVIRQDPNHLAVFATGKVSQIGQALQVNFARVTLEGKEYTSAITPPGIPAGLSPFLVGVNGLQPHIQMHRHLVLKPNSLAGPGAPYLPSQLAQAYHANGLYSQGVTGSGQAIAIVIDTYPSTSDLESFWS
ncbi:protease pro-enzyme activation domain-containing protein, partial [Methylacidiphilales bacterium]|nr:protease pro-enzyme activation domain-containing protein [Candidatus Methylacidiphilales bacterium]